jgi:phosphopantetheinyl transferase
MRLRDWEDWRFHWPSRYRDVFRQPREIFVGEELPLDDASRRAKAVWLAPPVDMARPIWRDVLEQTQLEPAERAAHLAEGGVEWLRAHRLWGRIAAKEAARRLWQAQGRPASYPADLAIVGEETGQPRLLRADQPEDDALPAISIAHAEGLAVAIAAGDPAGPVGIGVEAITDRTDEFDASAWSLGERALLTRWSGPDHDEWLARLWSAKQAAARAAGVERAATEVIHADEATGVVHVRLASCGTGILPVIDHGLEGRATIDPIKPLRVVSARRGDHAWAWTLGAGAEP